MATAKVTVRPCRVRGVRMFRVRFWEHGKPRRLFFNTKSQADAEAVRLRGEIADTGRVWLTLPAHEREGLIRTYKEAKASGVDLHKAIALAKSNGSNGVAPTLRVVIGELVEVKRKSGCSDRYTDNLEGILNQFAAGRESMRIDEFGLSHVEKFLDSKRLESRSTLRSRLSALFSFAVRRGYRVDNPCDRLEAVKVTRKPPAHFTVAQAKLAIVWLLANAPHGLAWFALSTACGLRPEEAEQTDPKRDINFREGFIRVEAQTTKVRQRRVVYPKPEAMEFLKWCIKRGGRLPLSRSSRMRLLAGESKKRKWKPVADPKLRHKKWAKKKEGLRGALGFAVWPKDITRHTAASYWLAEKGSSLAHVAKMHGHSESECESKYKALATQAEAREFWAMLLKWATKSAARGS